MRKFILLAVTVIVLCLVVSVGYGFYWWNKSSKGNNNVKLTQSSLQYPSLPKNTTYFDPLDPGKDMRYCLCSEIINKCGGEGYILVTIYSPATEEDFRKAFSSGKNITYKLSDAFIIHVKANNISECMENRQLKSLGFMTISYPTLVDWKLLNCSIIVNWQSELN